MIVLRRSLAEVLAALGLDEDALSAAAETTRTQHDAPAWYVRLLAGIAAWLASLSLLGCLGASGLLDDSGVVAAGLGLLCCAGAVALRHASGPTATFLPQTALACSLAGQSLAIGGVGIEIESFVACMLFGAALEVVLVAAYPDALHRFLSTVAAGVMLGAVVHDLVPIVPLHLIGAPLLAAAFALWQWEARIEASPLAALRAPVAYGCVACTFAVLTFGLWAPDTQRPLTALTTLGLTAVVTVLAFAILRELGRDGLSQRIGVGVAMVLLGLLTLNTPGIVAALGTMMLAFHRRSPLLLGMGAVFLAGFLTFFYYDMALSLWVKSGVLVGSGGLMLGARALLFRAPAPAPEAE